MFNKKITVLFLFLVLVCPAFGAVQTNSVKTAPQAKTTPVQYIQTTPLEIAASPDKYLNKGVVLQGKFDKFTTLGLDYNKAMRNSTDYIGFLVQRDDVKDHNVPLSELKLFIKRDYAEKFIDLNTGDIIKFKGKLFSTALNDGWIDVETIEVLEKAPDNKK